MAIEMLLLWNLSFKGEKNVIFEISKMDSDWLPYQMGLPDLVKVYPMGLWLYQSSLWCSFSFLSFSFLFFCGWGGHWKFCPEQS